MRMELVQDLVQGRPLVLVVLNHLVFPPQC